MNRYDYQFGITVNALGERFFDEGEAKHSYTYAKTGRAVLQPAGRRRLPDLRRRPASTCSATAATIKATMVEAPTHCRARQEDRHRAGGA